MVEHKGLDVLLPFVRQRATDGQFVVLDKGPLARHLQETVGDVLLNATNGELRSVEIKVEERFTGNLFLETWSNCTLNDRESRLRCGLNPGWMYKAVAELLFYYFLDNDHLYVFDLFKLQHWAFLNANANGTSGRIFDFRECSQRKHNQSNDTRGRIVPLSLLKQEVGYRLFNPSQLMVAA